MNHLNDDLYRIVVIFTRKGASKDAKELKRKIYKETKKVIIIFEDRHLHELLDRKRNNQDPLGLPLKYLDHTRLTLEVGEYNSTRRERYPW